MRFYVGVTNDNWYSFLAERRPDELNFWKPGGANFKAVDPGEPFLFKLHHPNNYIAGGGIFAGFMKMTVAEAWEEFGLGNGASDFEMLCRLLRLPPSVNANARRSKIIGCTVLVEPFFFERSEWIPAPSDWSPNIVQGKTYDQSEPIGGALWQEVSSRIGKREANVGTTLLIPSAQIHEAGDRYGVMSNGERYGKAFITRARLGQGAFRVVITNIYGGRCAITGEAVLPVLEAAHIRPFAMDGPHLVRNGLLLRSDLHTLFDRGFITITPEFTVMVSHMLRAASAMSPSYSNLHGHHLAVLPQSVGDYPGREFLEWHNETIFIP